MEELKKKKPNFKRQDWNKKVKLGKSQKKKRKWRTPVGIHSQIRLGKKGYAKKPAIGWGAAKKLKGKVKSLEPVRVENIKQLESVGKTQGIIIKSVGKKKKQEITEAANKMKITILNKYKTGKQEK